MSTRISRFSEEKNLVCAGISHPKFYPAPQQQPADDPDDALDEAESHFDRCCKMPKQHDIYLTCVDGCTQYHEKTATESLPLVSNKRILKIINVMINTNSDWNYHNRRINEAKQRIWSSN